MTTDKASIKTILKPEDLPDTIYYPAPDAPGNAITWQYRGGLGAEQIQTSRLDELLRALNELPTGTRFYQLLGGDGYKIKNWQEIAIRFQRPKEEPDIDIDDQTHESRKHYFKSMAQKSALPDFHYINEVRIRENATKEDTGLFTESMQIESTEAGTESLEAMVFKALGGKVEKQDIRKVITTITHQPLTIGQIYKRLLNELVDGRASIGSEIIDPMEIDSKPEKELDKELAEIQTNFTLQPQDIKRQRREAKIKSVRSVVKRLSDMRFQQTEVLIFGDFIVQQDKDGLFILLYEHPLSDYYEQSLRIVTAGIKNISPTYKSEYERRVGKFISVNIYGQVIQRLNIDKQIYDIIINPYAIY